MYFLNLSRAEVSEKLTELSSKGKMGHQNGFTFDKTQRERGNLPRKKKKKSEK